MHTKKDLERIVTANQDRLRETIAEGEAELASGKPLRTLDELMADIDALMEDE